MNHLKSLLVCTALVSFIQAFPDGARNNGSNLMESMSSHCTSGNFRPRHDNYMPQSGIAPYVISVSSPAGQIYKHGQTVSVTIQGTQGALFKGFFLQGDSTEASFAGTMQCTNGKQTSYCGKAGVTHAHRLPKNSVECTWSPPDHQIGTVQFVATFVKDKATFWTGVKSDVILHPDPKAMTYEQKAIQMRQQMMNSFQQRTSSGFRNMRGGNPFAAFLQGAGQNPFASAQGSESSNIWSMFGGGAGQSNSIANSNNQAANGERNQFSLSSGLGMANLPSQFGQFFGSQ